MYMYIICIQDNIEMYNVVYGCGMRMRPCMCTGWRREESRVPPFIAHQLLFASLATLRQMFAKKYGGYAALPVL